LCNSTIRAKPQDESNCRSEAAWEDRASGEEWEDREAMAEEEWEDKEVMEARAGTEEAWEVEAWEARILWEISTRAWAAWDKEDSQACKEATAKEGMVKEDKEAMECREACKEECKAACREGMECSKDIHRSRAWVVSRTVGEWAP
jgi:hypothetical protein